METDLFGQAAEYERRERAHIQRGDSLIPRARNGDAITSHEAAKHAQAFAHDHKACILGVMYRPMDASRIAKLTGLTVVQVCRRLPDLERQGAIRLTGNITVGIDGQAQYREWERVA